MVIHVDRVHPPPKLLVQFLRSVIAFPLLVLLLFCFFLDEPKGFFLRGDSNRHSSQPGACWLLVGEGLRYAQDIGVHRKGVKRSPDPVDNELFKRGFWWYVPLFLFVRLFVGFLIIYLF